MLQANLRTILGLGETTPEAGAEMGAIGPDWAVTTPARSVFVVDDDETIRELVAAVLEYEG